MVNSQTKISLESFHTVVPPRIDLFWLVMLTETVDQSQVQKILKFLTDFRNTKDCVLPLFRMFGIVVFGSNIEVSEQY